MINKTILIDDAEPNLLFGSNDTYLRQIEAAFPDIRIIARGNSIRLEGSSDEVDQIERIVREFITVVQRNGNLTKNDVDTIIALFRSKSDDTRRPMDGISDRETILHTPDGEAISPITPNQAALVKSAAKSDIVFAIGPAGTGKTYTAVALAVSALKKRRDRKSVV